ncbi:hypothetical protein [Actinomadura oligospora]|uniref:hypothetical protein n=1 Tax=Actinomadura oligospora TaxID=111804 RepID=UPI00047C92B4|nr:hypothetical protein [Actinomadura oligospora]
MNARIIPFPRRPRPVPVVVSLVTVDWDVARLLYVARCSRCADAFTALGLADADDWADTHTCDAELVALLAEVVIVGRAA